VTAARQPYRQFLGVAATVMALLFVPASSLAPAHSQFQPRHAQVTAHISPASQSGKCDPTASLRPAGPPVVASGSYMAKIRHRGYLIAGVDQNTYHFGYLNPLDDRIEGFDIDMVRAVAAAIFGNPNKIRFVSVSDAQRIPAVRSGQVDIVAHTMTITCDRLKKVGFSTVYLVAAQRVLVPRNSTATSLRDLHGNRICATTSSTSLAFIHSYFSASGGGTAAVAVPSWTDCLVLLQEGRVAAISTDDTILAGLAAQDPETKIIGPPLTSEPYGLAMSLRHPDFIRFVNAVLAKMRSDGQWAASYRRWVGIHVPPPPPAHYRG
jgi:polar amino acid transport system substrate-binding protein